jgi:hypothetical protein
MPQSAADASSPPRSPKTSMSSPPPTSCRWRGDPLAVLWRVAALARFAVRFAGRATSFLLSASGASQAMSGRVGTAARRPRTRPLPRVPPLSSALPWRIQSSEPLAERDRPAASRSVLRSAAARLWGWLSPRPLLAATAGFPRPCRARQPSGPRRPDSPAHTPEPGAAGSGCECSAARAPPPHGAVPPVWPRRGRDASPAQGRSGPPPRSSSDHRGGGCDAAAASLATARRRRLCGPCSHRDPARRSRGPPRPQAGPGILAAHGTGPRPAIAIGGP